MRELELREAPSGSFLLLWRFYPNLRKITLTGDLFELTHLLRFRHLIMQLGVLVGSGSLPGSGFRVPAGLAPQARGPQSPRFPNS